MTNPDPLHITDPMWWLWTRCAEFIPGVQLGGIYAIKEGYHNTVNANKKSWPWSYSIELPLDLTQPDNKARAIDLTMSTDQMILRTGYLKAAAEHPDDNRLYGLREFIGTLDGTSAFCMIKDTIGGPWAYDYDRDLSHTWHEHISIFTAFCDDMDAMRALASVLAGQTWEDWLAGGEVINEIYFNNMVNIISGWTKGLSTVTQTNQDGTVENADISGLYKATAAEVIAQLPPSTVVITEAQIIAAMKTVVEKLTVEL